MSLNVDTFGQAALLQAAIKPQHLQTTAVTNVQTVAPLKFIFLIPSKLRGELYFLPRKDMIAAVYC